MFQYAVFFKKYTIKDGERPETLAEKIYGNQFYDWVILLTNNMVNAQYDWGHVPTMKFIRLLKKNLMIHTLRYLTTKLKKL